ncbi:MAG: DNA polymerase, partial [Gammaproteobacteria bacterium]
MQTLKPADQDIEPTFIVFDLETQQEKEFKQTELGPMYLHEPNLCIAYKFCDGCQDAVLNQKNFSSCTRCGPNRWTFEGSSTISDFGEWLYSDNMGTKKNPVIAIAHNARGFDAQFLINYLAEKGYRPEIVTKGQGIMQMKAASVTIKDSLNFLPSSLAALPKTFGFQAKKGYFPHFFNHEANENYEGPLPDHQHYGTSTMMISDREKFFSWYTPLQKSGYVFNLKKERWIYCENDVFICAKSIMEFWALVIQKTQVDPILRAMTIASTTSIVYRQNFLPEKTIGLIPPGGYKITDSQSEVALIWLKYISESENVRIQHARNGGEKIITIGHRKISVDGYAEKNGKKIVYKFHGCRFHGCPRCFPNRQLCIRNDPKTMEERYKATVQKSKLLKEAGYEVIELWKCHLEDMRKRNPSLDLFFSCAKIREPMDPRSAFFGGRTNATKLLHEFKNGEKGHYVDVCSLYPTTLMYDEFPVGHPKIITENFQRITKRDKPYKGLIFCSIIPPSGLLHPVLPHRSLGKTTFPLCRTCVETHQKVPCKHGSGDRELTGTWTHVELNKAVDLGYRVTQIHGVYHYEDWMKYDGKDPKSGLFAEYILVFLKLKQEKTGWPSWVKTEADQETYICNYEERMGIKLDPAEIEKNAGLRAVAKLFLNSFWGKFGQRENLLQQKYVTPQEFFKLFHDPTVDLKSWEMIGGQDEDDESATMLVRYTKKEDFIKPLSNTNVVIAAFVTAHARIRLYSYLEELQDRVLYFDTDSVFYTSKPGEKNLPTGDYLGDLTDELAEYGDGSYVTEFISAGPKNYSYKVFSTRDKKIHQAIKVKG